MKEPTLSTREKDAIELYAHRLLLEQIIKHVTASQPRLRDEIFEGLSQRHDKLNPKERGTKLFSERVWTRAAHILTTSV